MFPVKYFVIQGIGQASLFTILLGVNKIFKDVASSNYLGVTFISVVTFFYI